MNFFYILIQKHYIAPWVKQHYVPMHWFFGYKKDKFNTETQGEKVTSLSLAYNKKYILYIGNLIDPY